jgi:hypothetical protein
MEGVKTRLEILLAHAFFVDIIVVVPAFVAVVMHTTRLVVKHLDAHLVVAFVEEVHQADLDVVDAGKLLLAGVEVHLPLSIEQDLHGPPEKDTACFPQVHPGRLLGR